MSFSIDLPKILRRVGSGIWQFFRCSLGLLSGASSFARYSHSCVVASILSMSVRRNCKRCARFCPGAFGIGLSSPAFIRRLKVDSEIPNASHTSFAVIVIFFILSLLLLVAIDIIGIFELTDTNDTIQWCKSQSCLLWCHPL